MKDYKYILTIFFIIFIFIYLFSLSPAYNSDDSPETTLAFHTLGVQHPPGYPLNTLIGKLFTFLPLGSLMFRANLMAVFFNILSGLILFIIIYKIIDDIKEEKSIKFLISIIGVIFYLFSVSVWRQGISAKGSIYGINAFFTCLVFYSVISTKYNLKYLYFFSFIYGLAMGNHWTSMIVIFPAFIFYFIVQYKKINIKNILLSIIFFIIGVSIYLFVFIRSKTEPVYAWGDTKTIKDFIWLISRAQYAGIEKKHTLADTINLLTYYLKHFIFNEYPIFGLFFIVGFYFLFKQKRNISILFLLSYFLLVISVANFATPPANTQWLIKPYLASANIYISLFLSCFILYITIRVNNLIKKIIVLSIFIFLIIYINFSNPGYSRYFIGYDYSKNMVKSICCNSILIAEGDMNIGAALYETIINKVDFVPVIPVVMQYEWYRNQVMRNFKGKINMPPNNPDIKTYIESVVTYNKDKTIYYTNVATNEWVKGLKSAPCGVFFVITNEEKVMINDFYFLISSFRGKIDKASKYDEFTQRLVFDNYATGYFALAEILRNQGKLVESIKYFNYGLIFQQNSAAYINYGLVYYQLQNYDKAEYCWKKSLELEPKNSVSYSNLAFIYINRGDFINARKMVDKALLYNPQNQTAINLKQKLNEVTK
ncbi:MAG: DUF2723 domain-containing protein [Candidatus Goldbacteria bacterium]|nr:DUF2723 domain-containing protein [Candidatus Goldiibacteriota bacterium]